MQPTSTRLILVLTLVAHLEAQQTGASLTGRITDPSAAVVTGARIAAINSVTNIRYDSVTNGAGDYYLANLPPAVYRLEIEKAGFKRIVEEVPLHTHDPLRLDFVLSVGSVEDSVTIEDRVRAVRGDSGAIQTVIERSFMEYLPLNGRTFQNLFQLAPGVVLVPSSFNDQGQFSVNGQRAGANYFSVDGASANFGVNAGPLGQSAGGALPAVTAAGGLNGLAQVDAVQEVRIQTSTFAAEFGRVPGAQVEISTRSGGNQFHGAVFDYFRNDKLDANDWFANQQRRGKPKTRQNDFGGVLGGPILRNRTFFFLSYEGLRVRQPLVVNAPVPSDQLRESASAALRPILAAYPLANGPDLGNGAAQFSASISNPTRLDTGSVRVDHTYRRVSLFGRFHESRSPAAGHIAQYAPSNLQAIQFDARTATVGVNWSPSPAVTNTVRFNYSLSRTYSRWTLTGLGGAVPFDSSMVFPSFADPDAALFTFAAPGLGSRVTFGGDTRNRQRQLQYAATLSYVYRAHQFKIGVDDRRLAPTYGRRAYETQFLYPATDAILNNKPSAVYVISSDGAAGLRVATSNLSLFLQDSWRVSSRLTLTYGLRWERNPAPEVQNRPAPWVVDQVTNLATMRLGQEGAPLWLSTNANFAPRAGAAYQIAAFSQWVSILRGGVGVFYDLGFGQLGDVFALNAQYYGQAIHTDAAFPLTPQRQQPPPLAERVTPVSQMAAFDPRLKLPYTIQWNLTFEQSMGTDRWLTASYAGAAGRRLLLQTTLANPSPSFNRLSLTRNGATSDYHALQVQFRRPLPGGLHVLASYVWSHSIDTASSDSFYQSASPGRASSSFDIRHSFAAAVNYDIPALRGRSWMTAALGNWSVSAMNLARTAPPVNVVATTAFTGGVYTDVLPNIVPAVPIIVDDPNLAGGWRINRAAFAAPVAGQTGTAPRNFLRGFSAWQSDLALRREFVPNEGWRLQFRAELFNVFNHPNFASPVNNLASPQFGTSTSMLGRSLGSGGASGGLAPLYQMGSPRSVQLAIKLQF